MVKRESLSITLERNKGRDSHAKGDEKTLNQDVCRKFKERYMQRRRRRRAHDSTNTNEKKKMAS